MVINLNGHDLCKGTERTMTSSVPNVVVLRLVVDNGLQSEGSNYFPGSLIVSPNKCCSRPELKLSILIDVD